MKEIFAIKRCPFCKVTASFELWFNIESTWLAQVKCRNTCCSIQPSAKYIPIRKSQKANKDILKEKILKALSQWNDVCPGIANEGIELDFEDIVKMSLDPLNHKEDKYSSWDETKRKDSIEYLERKGYEIIYPRDE